MANGAKTCPVCRIELPLTSFGTHARPNRTPGKRYVNSRCRQCSRNLNDPVKARNRSLIRRYGFDSSEFDRRLTEQGGCAICGSTVPNGKYWHVDHDHACCPLDARSCGECVRGILCHSCNTALGNAKDSVDVLGKMIAYLEKAGAGGVE